MTKSKSIAACIFSLRIAAPQTPAFEVASVKPTDPNIIAERRIHIAGRSFTSQVTLFSLITYAFDVQNYQVAPVPEWIGRQFYDIAAKAEGDEPLTLARSRLLIQSLLAERFQLQTHRELQQLQVYSLSIAKGGPKFAKSADGTAYSWRIPAKGKWIITRVDLPRLASSLTREAGRTVIDLTGLSGYYDVTLDWTPDQPPTGDGADAIGPSLFTALRDQLSLKLEARKHPIEMLVIDRVERPSPN